VRPYTGALALAVRPGKVLPEFGHVFGTREAGFGLVPLPASLVPLMLKRLCGVSEFAVFLPGSIQPRSQPGVFFFELARLFRAGKEVKLRLPLWACLAYYHL
jgi:hypothetical protein